jgi:large subunit ribosomal protein L6
LAEKRFLVYGKFYIINIFMSRYAKQPILIPDKIIVNMQAGGKIVVEGPEGALSRIFRPEIVIEKTQENTLKLSKRSDTKFTRALWGTYSAHLRNMLKGVAEPYIKRLVIEGVGFRAEASIDTLTLQIGFSHPVKVPIPQDLKVSVERNVIVIKGIDKERVGLFAARVRAKKKPEPYKGKGIRYDNEVVRRKQGKKSA